MVARAGFQATARLRNRSQGSWPAKGSTAVHLAYHWLTPEGKSVAWEGRRTDLLRDVASGTGIAQTLWVDAPQEPGRYLLELDPVREQVAWFSSRNGRDTVRLPVEVVPAATGDSQILVPTPVEPEASKEP